MKYLLTIAISCALLLISCNKDCTEAPVSDCEKTEQHQHDNDCCCCGGETEGCEDVCADCKAKADCNAEHDCKGSVDHDCCEGDTTKACCGDHECGDKDKK